MSVIGGPARRGVLAWLGAVAVAPGLPGCATGPDPDRLIRVRCTVVFFGGSKLDPEAALVVRLQDVSRMDVPAVVLVERRIRVGERLPPFHFEFGVEPERIDARSRYTVAARVEVGARLVYINDTAYPVLTQGAGDNVRLVLKRVSP
jgi:putative lipoprotein